MVELLNEHKTGITSPLQKTTIQAHTDDLDIKQSNYRLSF